MTTEIQNEMIPVPTKYLRCDNCRARVRDVADDAQGWVCCHKIFLTIDEAAAQMTARLTGQPQKEHNQHLCGTCWAAVERFVRASAPADTTQPMPESVQ